MPIVGLQEFAQNVWQRIFDVWMPIALSSVSNKRLIDCFTGYRYDMFRRTADVPPMRDFRAVRRTTGRSGALMNLSFAVTYQDSSLQHSTQ
jgi:hypothetical protein